MPGDNLQDSRGLTFGEKMPMMSTCSKFFPNMLPHQGSWVHPNAMPVDFKVQMRTGAEAGVADIADSFAGCYAGSGSYAHDMKVGVKGSEARVVVEYHIVAKNAVEAYARHLPGHGSPDRGSAGGGNVNSAVELPRSGKGASAETKRRGKAARDRPHEQIAVDLLPVYPVHSAAGNKEPGMGSQGIGKKLVRYPDVGGRSLMGCRNAFQRIPRSDRVINSVLIGYPYHLAYLHEAGVSDVVH